LIEADYTFRCFFYFNAKGAKGAKGAKALKSQFFASLAPFSVGF